MNINLKKIEKYIKIDLSYVLKGGFWLSFAQFSASISKLLIAVIFANHISKEEYGVYKYALSIISIILITTLPGINNSVLQSSSKNIDGMLKKCLKIKIKWGFLGSAISIILSVYYYLNNNQTLFIIFLISSIFIPIYESFSIYGPFLNGKKQFKIASLYSSLIQIISAIVIALTIVITENIIITIFVYLFIYSLLRILMFLKTYGKFSTNNKTDEKTIKYGKHLSLMNVLPTISQYIDNILLFHFLGPVQLAIYNFSIIIPTQIKSLFKNFQVLIMPKFMNRDKNSIKLQIGYKMIIFTIFLVIIYLIYILLSPYIYNLLFPTYQDSIFYSQIFGISIIFLSIIFPLSLLQSQLAIKDLYIYNISRSAIQIILIALLAYYFGIIGALLARIFSELISLVLITYMSKNI